MNTTPPGHQASIPPPWPPTRVPSVPRRLKTEQTMFNELRGTEPRHGPPTFVVERSTDGDAEDVIHLHDSHHVVSRHQTSDIAHEAQHDACIPTARFGSFDLCSCRPLLSPCAPWRLCPFSFPLACSRSCVHCFGKARRSFAGSLADPFPPLLPSPLPPLCSPFLLLFPVLFSLFILGLCDLWRHVYPVPTRLTCLHL